MREKWSKNDVEVACRTVDERAVHPSADDRYVGDVGAAEDRGVVMRPVKHGAVGVLGHGVLRALGGEDRGAGPNYQR